MPHIVESLLHPMHRTLVAVLLVMTAALLHPAQAQNASLPSLSDTEAPTTSEYAFRQITHSPQLYGISINAMLEDHEGYLWLGTSAGLYRYDGYELRNQHDVTPEYISRSELLLNLQEDGNNYLWVTQASSVEYIIFDAHRSPVDTRQYLASLGITCPETYTMHIDRHHDLWCISSDSVLYYSFADRQLQRYATPGLRGSGGQRLSVRTARDKLFILEGPVLRTFDRTTAAWTEERLDLTLPSIDNNQDGVKLAQSYVDSRGGYWLYSLFSEDILYQPADETGWHRITLPASASGGQNFIRAIVEMPGHGLWIATNHHGLFLYDPATGQLRNYLHHFNDAQGLPANNINSLYVDSHQTLWLGFYRAGIACCRPKRDMGMLRQHAFGEINAIYVTDGGMRWIGTDDCGLWRETPDGQVYHVDEIPYEVIADFECGPDGSLWIGTYDRGIYQLRSGFKVRHYSAENGQLPHDGASRLALDGYGRLWVGSVYGPFYYLDLRSGKYHIIRDETGADLMGNDLCYDRTDNRIILATYWGLWVQNLKSDSGQRIFGLRGGAIPFVSNHPHVLLADAHYPLLWMAHNDGISVADSRRDTLYNLSSDEGITGHVIALRQDPQHNIWAATPSSLSLIEPAQRKDGTFTFRVRHVLGDDVRLGAPFSSNAAAVTPQGQMLFGMIDGYYEYDSQAALRVEADDIEPRFSTISLGDSLIYPEVLPSGQQQLTLQHHSLPLTFSFYTGNPLNASSVRYAYRIIGLQDAWVETKANTAALLTLPSGRYEMQLKAMGANAVWSDVHSLYIEVEQPWWNSVWLRMLAAIAIIACSAYFVLRYAGRKEF